MPARFERSSGSRKPSRSTGSGAAAPVEPLPPTAVNEAVRDCVNHCADDENPMRCALVFVQQLQGLGKLTQDESREVYDRSLSAIQAMNSRASSGEAFGEPLAR